MKMVLLFVLALLSLSHAINVPSLQCISLLANDLMSKEEKHHWRSVYEELIQAEGGKEDLFALIGYQLMVITEDKCAGNEDKNNAYTLSNSEKFDDVPPHVSHTKKDEVHEDIDNEIEEEVNNDCVVLSELYHKAGGGISWGIDSCWSDVKHNCCSCSGIKCNSEARVTEVEIYGLRGELPSSLWDMSELEVLKLVGEGKGNGSGEVYPKGSVEQLLRFLDFLYSPPDTYLHGEIPYGEGKNMAKLRSLVLCGSFDEGCIPSFAVIEMSNTLMLVGEFECDLGTVELPPTAERLQLFGSFRGNLPQIPISATHVFIKGNFEGHINERYVKNLNTSMKELMLLGNFEGEIPSSISVLSELTYLKLVGNFEGIIPSSVWTLTHLTFLELVGSFEGTVPPLISNLSRLSVFYLIGNFGGNIPSSVSNMSQLTNLRLVGNFGGVIPSSIWSFSNLTWLELVGNFEGRIPSNISNLSLLTHLELVGNFEERFPSSISGLSYLTDLQVVGDFSGSLGIRNWCWKSLVRMRIVGNFGGVMSADELDMPQIEKISICCGLSITESDYISSLKSLKALDLSGNDVVFIGNSINKLTNLGILILDQCSLSSLPPLAPLPSLSYFSASHNNISTVGDVFFIPTMAHIDLSHNQIGGRFIEFSRSSRYKWPSLTTVSLANNHLTEFVLMESGSVPLLRTLDLSNNLLSGNLSYLMPLVFPSLHYADFHNNSLSGSIPSTFSRFSSLETLILGGNKDLRRGKLEEFGDDSTVYLIGSMSWACKDLRMKTMIGYYDIKADGTFQDYDNCTCNEGFYGKPPRCWNCEDVSPLATCPGSGMIYAPQGYWTTPPVEKATNTKKRYILPCAGAGTSGTRCRPEPKKYTKTCSEGYSGRMCSGCISGYFSVGNECIKCMRGTEGEVIMICCALIAFVFLVCISFSRMISESGAAKILVVFIQTLFYMWNSRNVEGSKYVSLATGILGHVKLPGPSCYINGWTYAATYGEALLLPVAIVMSILIIFVLRNLFLRSRKRELWQWRKRSEAAVVFAVYLTYVSFSSEVVSPIPCEEDPGLRKMFMTNNPDERCNETLRMISFALLFGVVLTIPGGLIFRYIKKGHPSKTSPLYTLSRQYRATRWMWEIVITSRRIILIIAFLMIPSKTVYQSLVVCVVVGGSLILQVRYLPFRTPFENILECCSLFLVMVNYGVVLQYGSPDTKQDSSMSYILVSVDILFAFGCISYIFRGFILTVVRTFTGKRRRTIDDRLRTSLVFKFPGETY